MIAPVRAENTVTVVTASASTRPLEMVLATPTPMNAPTRLKKAASAMACRGVSTRVDTTVAMALAAS